MTNSNKAALKWSLLAIFCSSMTFQGASAHAASMACHSAHTEAAKDAAYQAQLQNQAEEIIASNGASIARKEGHLPYRSVYRTQRGLGWYISNFGEALSNFMRPENKDLVLLDAGSGDSFVLDSITADHPKYLGVNYNFLTRSFEGIRHLLEKGRKDVLTGRFFENIPNSELRMLGKIGMIVDYYGVFGYSRRPDLIMKKYLEILEVNGEILMLAPFHQWTRHYNFYKWLNAIKGIRVEKVASKQEDTMNIRIIKTGEPISIPELKNTYLRKAAPPILYFKYTGQILTVDPNPESAAQTP